MDLNRFTVPFKNHVLSERIYGSFFVQSVTAPKSPVSYLHVRGTLEVSQGTRMERNHLLSLSQKTPFQKFVSKNQFVKLFELQFYPTLQNFMTELTAMYIYGHYLHFTPRLFHTTY